MRTTKASTKQILTMLVSLLISVLLWLTAMSSSDPIVYKKIENIPIELMGTNTLSENGLVIVNEIDSYVSITLYGRSTAMSRITESELAAYIDVSTLTEPGTYDKDVVISGLNSDINILHQSTRTVSLKIDIMATQEFTPVLTPTGAVSASFELGTYYSETKTVQAISNQETIEKIASVRASFSTKGKNKDFTADAQLSALDINGNVINGVHFEPETILVYATVNSIYDVSISPVTSGSVASGYRIAKVTITPSKATLSVPSNITLSEVNTAPISVAGKKESFETTTTLALPANVRLYNENTVFKVRVTIEPVLETSYTFSEISLQGQKEGLSYAFENFEHVTVTLTAAKSELEKLTRDQISLSVNVSEFTEGSHKAPITCIAPSSITVKSITPANITIQVGTQ